jgi:hypothetical protein
VEDYPEWIIYLFIYFLYSRILFNKLKAIVSLKKKKNLQYFNKLTLDDMKFSLIMSMHSLNNNILCINNIIIIRYGYHWYIAWLRK